MGLRMPGPEKHPKTGVYYFRQRVPTNLVALARGNRITVMISESPKTIKIGDAVKVTLNTKDPTTAKARYREVDTWLQGYWQSLLAGPQRLTPKQSLALAGEAYRAWVMIADEDPKSPELWQDILKTNALASAGRLRPVIGESEEVARLQKEYRFGPFADVALQRKGLVIDEESRKRLIDQIAQAMTEAALINLGKAQGDYSQDDSGARFPEWVDPASKARPAGQVSISGLFELWEREHKELGGSPTSARRWKSVINSFIEFAGHDDASAVTLEGALAWKDKLIGDKVVTPNTFRKSNRAAMNAIFRIGVERAQVGYNPFKELRSKPSKTRNERSKSFSEDEITMILKGALAASEMPGNYLKQTRDAIRWLPWLCAYSGSRINEVAQLHRKDVYKIKGFHCFVISPESGSVKDGDFRYVPLHRHLIQQGFLEFVASCPDGPLFYDHGNQGDVPAEAAARAVRHWVRTKSGVTDRRVAPNHGWRHTFKDIADFVGIETKYQNMICGHEGATEGDRYSTQQVPVLAREIERFPTYNL